MNNETLEVWYQKKHVGKIWQNTAGMMGFRYEESWIQEGFPVSQQLPLRSDEFRPDEGRAHRFFANLLPEAGARQHIIKALKIADTDFSLLKSIGGECAGALSIVPQTNNYLEEENKYKLLTDVELSKIILRKGFIYDYKTAVNQPRLSLAGAQDKCAIFANDDRRFFIPEGDSPSTHILKFELPNYKNIPLYECFINGFAKTIGLPVVNTDLKKSDSNHYLLIERYDRVRTKSNKVMRLHQEDFCQALGFGYQQKYQNDGGPSFAECYKLVLNCSINPILDAENLIKWQIFNLLVGNSDAHAKNLALLYNKQHAPSLAPFYDLVCTRAIEGLDKNLAMAIGGQFDPDKISQENFKKMANDCEIGYKYLKDLTQILSNSLLEQLPVALASFKESFGEHPALQRIQMVIVKQCKRMQKVFA